MDQSKRNDPSKSPVQTGGINLTPAVIRLSVLNAIYTLYPPNFSSGDADKIADGVAALPTTDDSSVRGLVLKLAPDDTQTKTLNDLVDEIMIRIGS
jgi:hypothetical protein